jgi:hypothetical protein
MPGATSETEAQGAPTTPPQGGEGSTPEVQGTTAPAAAETPPEGAPTVEALAAKNRELEADNRKYRLAAKAREDADRAKAAEGLSEAERLAQENEALRAERDSLKSRSQEQSLRLAATGSATRLGFRNPDIAVGLIATRVEYGEDGEPTNVDALLTALGKSDPYLLVQTDFGGGPRGTSPASGAPSMNDIIRGATQSSR